MQKYIFEIKNRVLLLLLTYILLIITIYYYKDILLFTIIKPKNIFNNGYEVFYFIFTDVTEIFCVYLKLLLFLSFQIIILMFLYHLFLFISPALYKIEFKYFKLTFISVSFVSLISFIIAYFIIIPLSWNFFLSFQDLIKNKSFNIHFEIKLIEYFNFYISLYYFCNLYFQFFVIIFFFFNYITKSYKSIKKFRKIFYFIFICISTFFCPEILSQILISLVFIIFYESFLFFCIFVVKFI